MVVEWLFPTPVLHADLQPDSEIAAGMEAELACFDQEVFGQQQFNDRNNLTGDLLGSAGLDQLHRSPSFQWLNQQLSLHVSQYLELLLGPEHGLESHIQKAWPVVCAQNGGEVELHTHRNAQLSAVFYVKTEAENSSGELEFLAPDDYFSHVMAIPFSDAAVSGGVFAPKQHRLLLFPSDLRHRVTPYEGGSPRYSVSYDIAITTASGRGHEMRVPHPMDWVPMSLFHSP